MFASRGWWVVLLACMVSVGLYSGAEAQTQDVSADYINSVFYTNRLQVVRTSYDRWDMMDRLYPDKTARDINEGFYSTIYDFNYGRDADGNAVYPMMLGFASAVQSLDDRVGYYFLMYNSDAGNIFRGPESDTPHNFVGFTVGSNLDFEYITLQGDVSWLDKEQSYFGKVYIPFLKTFAGMSFAKRELIENAAGAGLSRIVESDELRNDIIDTGTSIFRYVNLGFKYYRLLEAKWVPNVSVALHEFVPSENWEEMRWDADLFFETRGQKLGDAFTLENYEARFTLYYLAGDEPLLAEWAPDGRGTVGRIAWFGSVSYKSPEDEITAVQTAGRTLYTGADGWGAEVGWVIRVMGMRAFGFREDSYVKFSIYENYSQYFERFPAVTRGLKFRVVL